MFVEKINRARKVQFSPYEIATQKVSFSPFFIDLNSLCCSHNVHPSLKCPESAATHMRGDSNGSCKQVTRVRCYTPKGRNLWALNGWIGRAGSVAWPAISPDVTSVDFFLWVYTKDQVYRTRVTYLQGFKKRIVHSVEGITPQMCDNALGHCAANKGSWDWSAVKWRKGVGKYFWVAVSYGETCTLLALYFLDKMFKMCALILGHPGEISLILWQSLQCDLYIQDATSCGVLSHVSD
jgi:hypothetical protein